MKINTLLTETQTNSDIYSNKLRMMKKYLLNKFLNHKTTDY